jgi:hypothetical protein
MDGADQSRFDLARPLKRSNPYDSHSDNELPANPSKRTKTSGSLDALDSTLDSLDTWALMLCDVVTQVIMHYSISLTSDKTPRTLPKWQKLTFKEALTGTYVINSGPGH